MKPTTAMREMLEGDGIIIAPGAFDALSARIIERAGFRALSVTGYGVSASFLGRPDIGLMTMSEIVGRAGHIVDIVDIPVIADADTGYGGCLNVMRTVEEFEKAGVAGIHIEDQVTPKRCGHMEGVRVTSLEEMLKKIEAALAARRDPDFLVIARTDAAAVCGLEEGIKRGKAMAQAGADVVYVESIRSRQELKLVAESIDVPVMVNMMEDGVTPILPAKELGEIGFKIVIFPLSCLYISARAMMEVMDELRRTGTSKASQDRMASNEEISDLLGLPKMQGLEERFSFEEKR